MYASVSVTDDDGATVTLSEPATRIVSFAPSLTENLFAIGAGAAVVGVSEYSDYPEQAKRLPRVSGYNRIDLEAVVTLKPDLVLAWSSGNPREQVNRLRELGIPVFMSEPRSLQDIATTLQRLGVLTGRQVQADAVALEYEADLAAWRAKYRDTVPIRVFFQIWDEPLMTVRDDHLISDVIHLCGGRTLFPDLFAVSASVDREAVIVRDPQVIMSHSVEGDQTPWREPWLKWTTVAAVKNRQFYVVPADLIARHSPRILEGVRTICDALDAARRVYGNGE